MDDVKSFGDRFEALVYYGTGDEGVELFRQTCGLAYMMNGIGDNAAKVETLYAWAKEQADGSAEYKDDDPADFEHGHWGYP